MPADTLQADEPLTGYRPGKQPPFGSYAGAKDRVTKGLGND